MSTPSVPARTLLVGLTATTLVLSGAALAAPAAQAAGAATSVTKVNSIVRTGSFVPGYCSSPSGFVTNAVSTVGALRLTVSPSSPRAGQKMTVKVAVKHRQATLVGASYPKGILRAQVVVKAGAKSHVLKGPINKRDFTGQIFPTGWTAKGTFKAPAKGKRGVSITRIVYNARGAFNGDWDTDYAGFDLVCSGGQNPLTMATPYERPRITLKVRKKL